ncbi:hypothetical protein DSO57_1004483 [Entomophthora muscae]|uniref:Uncharacterized protein n=1 Tax=Entomophthora muscae TaxID=34485 RepID=A0ACC2UTR4_9FUNG|nr:hypothetical protein DSO57_1004483 [Entomophthora muscae]
MKIGFLSKSVYNLSSEGYVNDLLIGAFLSKEPLNQLAVATSSGKILLIVEGKVKATLNPKSGSILSLASGPLTSKRPINLIAGDCSGQVTFFLGSQMVSKVLTSHPVQSLAFVSDIAGNHEIVSGSSLGHLASYHLQNRLWRLTLNDSSIRTSKLQDFIPLPASKPVHCIFAASLSDNERSAETIYTFAINGTCDVHMLSGQHLVLMIRFPKPIITGCKGFFQVKGSKKNHDDTLFASRDGQVYILDSNLKPQEYVNSAYSIVKLLAYRPKGLPMTAPSFLVITGLSDCIFFYHERAFVQELQVPDWVSSAAVGDLSDQLSATHNFPQGALTTETLNLFHTQQSYGHFIVFALADSTIHLFTGTLV